MDYFFDVIALIALEWRDVAIGHKEYSLSLFALAFLIGGLFFSLIKAIKISALMQKLQNGEQALQQAEAKQQELSVRTIEQATQLQTLQQQLEQKQSELESANQAHKTALANQEQRFLESDKNKQNKIESLNQALMEQTDAANQLQQDMEKQISQVADFQKQIDAFKLKEQQLLTSHVDLRRQLESLQNENVLIQSRYQQQVELAEMYQSKHDELLQQLEDEPRQFVANKAPVIEPDLVHEVAEPVVNETPDLSVDIDDASVPESEYLNSEAIESAESVPEPEIETSIEVLDVEPTDFNDADLDSPMEANEIASADEQRVPDMSSELNETMPHTEEVVYQTSEPESGVIVEEQTVKTTDVTLTESLPQDTVVAKPVKPDSQTIKKKAKLGGMMNWFASLDQKLSQAGLAEHEHHYEPPQEAESKSAETIEPLSTEHSAPEPENSKSEPVVSSDQPQTQQENLSISEPETESKLTVDVYADEVSFSERLADMADTMDAVQGKLKGLFKRKK